MWWDGDAVMGKIEVLDTPSGNILKALVKSNVKLGISSRGLGTVKESNGVTMVEDDFQLICFDIVSEPSTPGAYLSPKQGPTHVNIGSNINQYLNENKESKINDLFNCILKD